MSKNVISRSCLRKGHIKQLATCINTIDTQPNFMTKRQRIKPSFVSLKSTAGLSDIEKQLFDTVSDVFANRDEELDHWLRGISSVLDQKVNFFLPTIRDDNLSTDKIELFNSLTKAWLAFYIAHTNKNDYPDICEDLNRLSELCEFSTKWITSHDAPEEKRQASALWTRATTLTIKRHISPEIRVSPIDIQQAQAAFESRMFAALPSWLKQWLFALYKWLSAHSPRPVAKIFSESHNMQLNNILKTFEDHNNIPNEDGFSDVDLVRITV